jgi:hypothetical protein
MVMDLWQFLRESVGYDGSGSSAEWTEFGMSILLGSQDVTMLSSWYNKQQRHYFLRAVVPESRSIAVPSSHVIDTLRFKAAGQGVHDLSDRIPLFLRGHVKGKPGDMAILDGTIDQHGLISSYVGNELEGGFYGAEALVPWQCRDLYTNAGLYKMFDIRR